MSKTLTLKFPATCADASCGAALPAGTRAKWYGRGRVYGLSCHTREGNESTGVFDEQTGTYAAPAGGTLLAEGGQARA